MNVLHLLTEGSPNNPVAELALGACGLLATLSALLLVNWEQFGKNNATLRSPQGGDEIFVAKALCVLGVGWATLHVLRGGWRLIRGSRKPVQGP